jgi:hypothetical protein
MSFRTSNDSASSASKVPTRTILATCSSRRANVDMARSQSWFRVRRPPKHRSRAPLSAFGSKSESICSQRVFRRLTQCMVRPCVARGFRRAGISGLASMYPVSDWSCFAPDQYGYQRACDLITGQASTGHLGHQCSHAPGRPILHLFSSSRRPRRVKGS